MPQHPREGAIRPRMRLSPERVTLCGEGAGVGPETHPRFGHDGAHILFRHQEIDRPHARVVHDDEVHRRFDGVFAMAPGDFAQGKSGIHLKRVVLEADQHDALGVAGELVEILPFVLLFQNSGFDLGALHGVFESRHPGVVPVFHHIGRHDRGEGGGRRGVRIHVRGNGNSGASGGFDAIEHGLLLGPIGLARRFQMEELGAHARFAADVDHFVDGLEKAVAFAADVGNIESVVRRGGFGQGDDFVGAGEGAGRVDERGAESHRALFHRLRHEGAHGIELSRGGSSVFMPHHVNPHSAGTDVAGHVGRDTPGFQVVEIVFERDVRFARRAHGGVVRAHGPAFAHHFEGDSLQDVAHGSSVVQERFRGPTEHVDIPWRKGEARGVDGVAHPGFCLERTDMRDRITRHIEVSGIGSSARSVDDPRVPDGQIIVVCLASGHHHH